jgi:hypothetical protein
MVSGVLTTLAALASLTAVAGPEKAVAQRYKLDVAITQNIDATAAGQGVVTSEITGTALLTLTMSDTAGGQLAHLVIDSFTVSADGQAGAMFSQELANALKGQFIHGYVVDGKLSGTAKPSVEDNQTMNLVMPAMNALFPGIGARASSAETWTDTTRNNTVNEQGTQNSESIVTWTVTGRNGEVLSLTGAAQGTVTIEAAEQQVSGTVTSTSTVTSVVGGPSTSATLESKQVLSVLIAALPDPLPVSVETRATLTQIP